VKVFGSGPLTLLMVHGYGCNQAMWRRMAPTLAERWQVVMVDLVGFGQSDFSAWTPTRYAGLDGHAQDLVEVLQHLKSVPLVTIGHSVGATICVLAELMDPALVAAHIMVAPSPCFADDGDYQGGFARRDLEALLARQEIDMFGWSERVAGLVMKQPGTHDLTMELVRSFCGAHPPAAKALARATFLGDYREAIAEVSKPTLIVQSLHDDLASVRVGEYMAERMPASTLRVIPTWGHCPHLLAPEACLLVIESFLEEQGAAGRLNIRGRSEGYDATRRTGLESL
jgi:sigma-B regulation protein RsbQ